MADFISRDYAVENMENFPWDTEHDKNAAIHLVRELVPAADVRPVVRAFWVGEKDGIGVCSNCKRLDHIDPLATHCRYCGADMRETGR